MADLENIAAAPENSAVRNTAAADTVRWPQDSTCIEVDQPDKLRFWSGRLHVSAGMLRHAVRVVGCKFKDVTEFLTRRASKGSSPPVTNHQPPTTNHQPLLHLCASLRLGASA